MAVAFAERAGEPAMTDDVPTEDVTWERMLRAWQELDIPAGWRAEVHGKDIVVVPPPANEHSRIVNKVDRSLFGIAPQGADAYQNIGVQIPALSKLYIPDLAFVAEADLPQGTTPVGSSVVLMTVEITSPANADDDREEKRVAYARGEVPLYLLIDPWDPAGPTVTLFSEPSGADYAVAYRVPFGKPVPLPDPFGVDLQTDAFPLHPKLRGSADG